ncbi:MAG: chorismate mutase [Chloroflexota bacterium]
MAAVAVRGIRGATTVEADDREAILDATRELLTAMVTENAVATGDIAAALFTVTEDITAAFPAAAARDLGWDLVPLLDAREIPVPGALARCIRVLLLVNTERGQAEISHVYLKKASALREDLRGGRRID